jgi:toxin ParE1/3/4
MSLLNFRPRNRPFVNQRCLTLTGFPYVIVYNAERTPPRIIRILHGARDLPEILRGL